MKWFCRKERQRIARLERLLWCLWDESRPENFRAVIRQELRNRIRAELMKTERVTVKNGHLIFTAGKNGDV